MVSTKLDLKSPPLVKTVFENRSLALVIELFEHRRVALVQLCEYSVSSCYLMSFLLHS